VARTSVARTSVARTSVARTSVARTSVARTSVARTSVARDLGGADLGGADLGGADLAKAVLETGETYEKYLSEVVPALLTAGGETVKAIVEDHKAWDCHDWNNCPMACAFKVHTPAETPILLRPRVDQFVRMFDQGLIPKPKI
jgi:hypothetical protein